MSVSEESMVQHQETVKEIAFRNCFDHQCHVLWLDGGSVSHRSNLSGLVVVDFLHLHLDTWFNLLEGLRGMFIFRSRRRNI